MAESLLYDMLSNCESRHDMCRSDQLVAGLNIELNAWEPLLGEDGANLKRGEAELLLICSQMPALMLTVGVCCATIGGIHATIERTRRTAFISVFPGGRGLATDRRGPASCS